jgi:hypothetical protein
MRPGEDGLSPTSIVLSCPLVFGSRLRLDFPQSILRILLLTHRTIQGAVSDEKGVCGLDGIFGARSFVRQGLAVAAANPQRNHSPKTKHQPMKKLLFTLITFVTCVAAFAQGKINLINDAASLVMFSSNSFVNPADASLRGQPIGNSTPLPSGVTLTAGLWGGTSLGALFLYSTTALTSTAAGSAGVIGPMHIQLTSPLINGIPSGTPIGASTPWFDVRVWDAAYATYDAAIAAGAYTGAGAPFQMNPGNSIAYPNTAGPSANSTWTEGPIYVGVLIPEPSTFALAGLAGAAMLILRRRK